MSRCVIGLLPGVLLASLVVWTGCSSKESAGPSGSAGSGNTAKSADTSADEVSEPSGESADAAAGNVVQLPDDSLLAGIPGAGPLTLAEIQAWLDDPKNHEILDIRLPLGLAAGSRMIKGLDSNPLTRAKIELGRQLYFDPRLSSDRTISCASCHDPNEGFTKHTQFGIGVGGQTGNRNSPVSYNRILSDLQFWDGRAASLEEQAVGPIANPIEMGNTHDACVECLRGIEGYRLQFDRIFGEAWGIEQVGQAIAAMERVIVTGPSPFDYYEQLRPYLDLDLEDLQADDPETYQRYLEAKRLADQHPMSESAIRGHKVYFSQRGGCSACHVGPNLTDEKYHNLGVGMEADEPDLGRWLVTKEEKDRGAFKTPTIRNVALSAPYMHDGSLATLEDVVDFYDKGGIANPWLSKDIRKLKLTDQEKQDLVEFMKACTGPFPKIEPGRLPAD